MYHCKGAKLKNVKDVWVLLHPLSLYFASRRLGCQPRCILILDHSNLSPTRFHGRYPSSRPIAIITYYYFIDYALQTMHPSQMMHPLQTHSHHLTYHTLVILMMLLLGLSTHQTIQNRNQWMKAYQ